ncbi:MAG: CDGSH iron-sulfur domain-containing protein [Thermoanaerobaculia bacterium]
MSRKKIYDYESPDIVVRFEAKRCIHAEECVHGLPEVFDRQGRPWIEPEKGSAGEIAEVVLRCPTGALRFERLDGWPAERTPVSNSGRVVANGPVYLEGDLELQMPDGSVLKETRVALCRCGASKNKPFCDNSHIESGFEDPGAVTDRRRSDSGEEGEQAHLEIRVNANGSLACSGPLEIKSADGTGSDFGVKGSLCRCGASQNKPFCDG